MEQRAEPRGRGKDVGCKKLEMLGFFDWFA